MSLGCIFVCIALGSISCLSRVYTQKMASSSLALIDAADEDDQQAKYDKIRCDPSISVADLEGALEAYFAAVGYRNMQEAVDLIIEGKVTWKSAAKAVWVEI